MNRKRLALIVIFLLSRTILFAQNDTVRDDAASSYNLNQPDRVEWFRNAGSGLFIHFSVDAQLGIVISHSLVGASDDYANRFYNELPQSFDPARFNPYEIAVLARLAGMKYIMFTAKHHSGFCMWDTKTTAFNIMNTPYHKDLLKEFVEATRKAGLQVGFYFSPEDFNFLRLHNIAISRTDVVMNDGLKKEFDDYTRQQCEELMRQYGKIDLLFIDGEPKETVKATCWKWQPDILITRGALKTPEQVMPGVTITDPWLSCITMGTAWQFQPTNERYKPGTQLIGLLIEARSKGGNLLLNIGPRADGALPEEQEGRLREMAAWYFINKEAVDSVRPWVISNEGNIWFTTTPDKKTLYAFITGLPDWKEGTRKSFVLHSVKSTAATHLNVLGQSSRMIEYNKNPDVNCTFRQTDTGLVVSVVKAQRIYDDHRWPNPVVMKLENVLPAINPLEVETLPVIARAGKTLARGRILHYGHEMVKACFYYRPYRGQLETLYAGPWQKTGRVMVQPDGSFEGALPLAKGAKYEYRAAIEYARIEMNGENKIAAWQF